MNKIFCVALAAGVAGFPQAAQSTNVTISGRVDVTFERVGASDSTAGVDAPDRNRVSDNTSFLRFSGAEDLGRGLKAIFQVESGLNVDSGGISASTGTFASRNSRVGLTDNWGTVFYGTWDTPYKYSTTGGFDLDPWGTWGLETSQALIGNGASTNTSGAGFNRSSFERRQRNTVQYWTPIFSGLQGRIGYGANEEKGTVINGTVADPSLWSVAGIYESGPLYLAVGYERHNEYQGDSTTDDGIRLGAAYSFGVFTLSALFERLDYETLAGDLKRNAYLLGIDWKLGPGSIKAFYIRARDGSGSAPAGTAVGNVIRGSETGAEHWTVGYKYPFSKRTAVYTYYSRIENEDAATYDFDTNPVGIPGPGASPHGVVLGIEHSF